MASKNQQEDSKNPEHQPRPQTKSGIPQGRPQSAGISKTQKLTPSSKAFEKLSDREKTETYLSVYEQNLKVTQNYNELQQRVKTLTIQLTKLASEVQHERQGESTPQLEQLRQENQRLKSKLKETTTKAKPTGNTVGPMISKYNTRPKVLQKQPPVDTEKDDLILRLKDQLQKTEEQLVRALEQKGNAQDFYNENKAKADKLNEMESRFLTLEDNYTAQKTYLEYMKQALNDTQDKLRNERTDKAELEIKLKAAEMAATGSSDMALKVKELYEENKALEERIKELCKSPFIKEAGTRLISTEKLSQATAELQEKVQDLASYKEKVLQLEGENFRLTQEVKQLTQENQKLNEEKVNLSAGLQQKTRYVDEFEKQLRGLSGGNVDTFMKAIGNMKLQGDEPAWAQLDFIERNTEIPNDIPSLRREVERLKLEKGQLASELEKCKSLLALKDEIEGENVSIVKRENEQLKIQLNASKARTEELSRITPNAARLDSVFIEEGTEVGSNENILDLWIGEAEYKANKLSTLLKATEVLSFITADFYEHETQTTSMCEGYRPKYHLHISFTVQVSDFFIDFLEKNSIVLEAHFSDAEGILKLARGEIPLESLVYRPGEIINSAIYLTDGNSSIGSLSYKLRMRFPLTEQIRAFQERKSILKRVDPPGKQRALLVTISMCKNLNGQHGMRPYVYYQLYNQKETFTGISRGESPVFDHSAVFYYNYNDNVRKYVSTEALEVFVFDDLTQKMLASAKVGLGALAENAMVNGEFALFTEEGQEAGHIQVRMAWTDIQASRALY